MFRMLDSPDSNHLHIGSLHSVSWPLAGEALQDYCAWAGPQKWHSLQGGGCPLPEILSEMAAFNKR